MERIGGADGDISVQWKTSDGSAKSPKDYQGGEGTLVFKHGEVSALSEGLRRMCEKLSVLIV